MLSPRSLSLLAFSALLSLGSSDPNSVCRSYGVDFVDEGDYFINGESNEPFTCVSTFKGCNDDLADVLLVDPSDDEYLCSKIGTVPEDDPKLSTCPIMKNQMDSGHWIILILGNNDDGNPFAWQRDIYLDVGPQVTSTITPTVTYNVTTTPIISSTSTSTFVTTTSVGPFTTVTIPSATAKQTETVTPPPVTTTSSKIFTLPVFTITNELSISTKTVTASCTTPNTERQDKPCTYSPTLVHPAALETPTSAVPKFHRYVRKSDRAVDVAYARERIAAAKLRRDQKKARTPAQLEERAPDAPTITTTASTPVNTTLTVTAPASTTTIATVVSSTATTTLPPATVYSGIFTSTATAPTPTKTKVSFGYTKTTSTLTIRATITTTTTVTPSASVTACKKAGGVFGPGRI